MSGNAFQVVIELPRSDGFHTVNDRHIARIVQDRVRDFLNGPGGLTSGACTVRIEPAGE